MFVRAWKAFMERFCYAHLVWLLFYGTSPLAVGYFLFISQPQLTIALSHGERARACVCVFTQKHASIHKIEIDIKRFRQLHIISLMLRVLREACVAVCTIAYIRYMHSNTA